MVTHPVADKALGRQVFYNTLSNYIGQFVMIGVGILLTPVILHRLGPTLYGLWVLVGALAGYGSLLDLGIASAITKYTAQYRAAGKDDEFHSLIATALCLYSALGLLTLLLTGTIALFFPNFFQVPPESQPTAMRLLLLAGLSVGLAIPAALPMAILRGWQRFDLVNLISVTGTLLSAGLTVLVLWLGGSVISLMVVNIATTLLMQLPSLWLIRRIAPDLRLNFRLANYGLVRTVATFSSSLFVINLAGHLQSKTDEIVIAKFLPLATVAPYALARRLSETAHIFTQQLIKVLLPLAAELHAHNEGARLRAVYVLSTRLSLVMFLPIGGTLVMLAQPLLTLWVGAAYADTTHLVLILTVAGAIDISQWSAVSILTGMARHRPLALIAIGSGLTNLVLSLILVQYWGVTGVALGTLIPVTIECLGFVLPYALRVLGLSVGEALQTIFWPALAPLLPMLAVLYLLQQMAPPTALLAVMGNALIGMLVYGGVYLLVGASLLERQMYRNLLESALQMAHSRFHKLMAVINL